MLLHFFNTGTSARRAALEVSVNRSTAQLFYRKLRRAIFKARVKNPKISGTVEVDECYLSSGEGGRKVAVLRGKSPLSARFPASPAASF